MRILLFTLIAASGLFGFEYGLKPQKLHEAVYCFFGATEAMDTHNNGNMVNTCYVDLIDSWLVIDSGPTYAYALEAHKTMNAIKDMPVTAVIDTHIHDDHWLGNGYYKSIGATVLGSGIFAHEINVNAKTRMQNRITKAAYEKTFPVLPTKQIAGEYVMPTKRGDVIIRIFERRAHSAEDIYVSIASLKVLFAGDLVFNDRLPSLRDGDINGWIAAIENLESLKADVIVGGHGYASGKDALNFTKNYLLELKTALLEAIDNGVGITDATATVPMQAYAQSAMYDELHAANVNAAYRTLEWGDE